MLDHKSINYFAKSERYSEHELSEYFEIFRNKKQTKTKTVGQN